MSEIYQRSVLFGGALFIGMCAFPILVKWVLIGRWKDSTFPVWSLNYIRFWTVKTLVHANPMVFFVGTPLYVLYLRALGARIGKGVTILSRTIPVCTDLLTIGSATVICKDTFFLCYRAHTGRIQIGSVTLGKNVYIGEKTVLDINTSMGHGTQLGHTSSLQSGQTVPDGQHRHGSPAQPTQLNYLRVAPVNLFTNVRTLDRAKISDDKETATSQCCALAPSSLLTGSNSASYPSAGSSPSPLGRLATLSPAQSVDSCAPHANRRADLAHSTI